MAAPGRFQKVRTDHGWHGRIVGGNGETVWWTEKYPDHRTVDNAFDVFAATLHQFDTAPFTKQPYPPLQVETVDERDLGRHSPDCPIYPHQHGRLCDRTCPCGAEYV